MAQKRQAATADSAWTKSAPSWTTSYFECMIPAFALYPLPIAGGNMPITSTACYFLNQGGSDAVVTFSSRIANSPLGPSTYSKLVKAGDSDSIVVTIEFGPDANPNLIFANIRFVDEPQGMCHSTPGTFFQPEVQVQIPPPTDVHYPTLKLLLTQPEQGLFELGIYDFNNNAPIDTVGLSSGTLVPPIEHVFVLMLENRSFDHLLGYSEIAGTDAVTGAKTGIDGLTGNESNAYGGTNYRVTRGAKPQMTTDPGHEFADTYEQLVGPGQVYETNAWYGQITATGFASNYATSTTEDKPPLPSNRGDIMACCDPTTQVPVLLQLAQEFAVCDRWLSSMPGPTWPNRFYAMAASSNTWDDSPPSWRMGLGMTLHGFDFPNGHIFSKLTQNGIKFRLYNDFQNQFGISPSQTGNNPIVAALAGVSSNSVRNFWNFRRDLKGNYDAAFTFIEPNYGHIVHDYVDGSSQHPKDSLKGGEAMIAATYNAISNSPIWNKSLLIITYDEHGGFYDHYTQNDLLNGAFNPGGDKGRFHGFDFQTYGVRVPAVVVSPWIARGTIDHTVYDHSSILKTLETLFMLPPLTERDRWAASPLKQLSLAAPRTDYPKNIPIPTKTEEDCVLPTPEQIAALEARPLPDKGNIHGFLHIAAKTEFELAGKSPGAERVISARLSSLETYGDARRYIEEVQAKAAAAKAMYPED